MGANVIAVAKEARHAVGGNSRYTQIASIGRAGAHDRNRDHAWPYAIAQAGDSLEHVRTHRRRGPDADIALLMNRNLVVADGEPQRLMHRLNGVAGKYT